MLLDIQRLREHKYNVSMSLVENLVLMSYGRISQSMTHQLLNIDYKNPQALVSTYLSDERVELDPAME